MRLLSGKKRKSPLRWANTSSATLSELAAGVLNTLIPLLLA